MEKIIFGILSLFMFMWFGSCTTGRVTADLIEHQRAVDALEAQRDIYSRAVDNAIRGLEAITARSENQGRTIDELIGLFDEYDRGVRQLIQEYNNLKNTAPGAGSD